MPNSTPAAASRATVGRLVRTVRRAAVASASGQFLRRQMWAWPILAAVVLGSVGLWTNHSVESAMRERRAAEKRAALVEVRRCSALGTSWLPCNTLGWCWRSVLQRGKRFTTRSCNAHQVLQQCVLLRFLPLPLPSHRILG